MKNNKVNCDARVDKKTKDMLEQIAQELSAESGLKIKRSDVQRAAFSRYIDAYAAGEIVYYVEEAFLEKK